MLFGEIALKNNHYYYYAASSFSWSVEVNGRHSSPYNSMDATADRQGPILIASFAFELKIERGLVAAAHALDKRDRKTVFALEMGVTRYSNLSQLSAGSPFAKRACLTEDARSALPWFC